MGDDDLAEQLRAANQKESVESAYYVVKGEKTGACAVVLTGHHRCVVDFLKDLLLIFIKFAGDYTAGG